MTVHLLSVFGALETAKVTKTVSFWENCSIFCFKIGKTWVLARFQKHLLTRQKLTYLTNYQ